jgi:hypothetical protein
MMSKIVRRRKEHPIRSLLVRLLAPGCRTRQARAFVGSNAQDWSPWRRWSVAQPIWPARRLLRQRITSIRTVRANGTRGHWPVSRREIARPNQNSTLWEQPRARPSRGAALLRTRLSTVRRFLPRQCVESLGRCGSRVTQPELNASSLKISAILSRSRTLG